MSIRPNALGQMAKSTFPRASFIADEVIKKPFVMVRLIEIIQRACAPH